LVGIMEVMATLLYTGHSKLGNTGYRRSRLKSMGSAMMGHCWWREVWSDRIDRSDPFQLQDGIGLAEVVHF